MSAMTLHKSKFKIFLYSSLLSFTLAVPQAATAAMALVKDAELNAKQNKQLALQAQANDEERKQTELAKTQNKAIGEPGTHDNILKTPAWNELGSQSQFYQNMEKFGFDMCAINLCPGGDNPTDTKDIDEARAWAERNLFASTKLTTDQEDDLTEIRRRAIAYTASNAFALSTTIHNELVSSNGTAAALEEFAKSAASARNDTQALSGITLEMYKVTIQQLAVLSAMLDLEAAQALQHADLYHENGGTTFADAYIRSDFRDDLTRQSYTPVTKGSPE